MEPRSPRSPEVKRTIGPATIRRIIGSYAVFGAVWVSSSDIFVYLHGGETRQDALLSLLKGLLFVAVSGLLLHVIIHRSVRATVFERDSYRERLREFCLDGNDIVLLLNEKGQVVEANDRAVDAYGYSVDELRNKTLLDLVGETTRFDERWISLLQQGTLRAESTNKRADGSTFSVEYSARRFDIGNSAFVHTVIRDISARQAAEKQLLNLKDTYAALFQTNQCIAHCSDREQLFQQACDIAVSHTLLKLAWIGLVDPSSHRRRITFG
jgi:PAS domain S-box-containing protein